MISHPMADTRGGARTRWQRLALALVLALVLPGCPNPEPPPEPDPAPDPSAPDFRLELGQGEPFTPTAEGDPVLVQLGPQGGQMTIVSLRAWELLSLNAIVDLALTDMDTGKTISQGYHVRLFFTAGTTQDAPAELNGLQLVLSGSAPVGHTVQLTATVQSSSGQKVAQSRTGPLQWLTNP